MSYCVNCGVELDAALKKCPLCGTKVYHPDKEQTLETKQTFPKKKGEVEKVSKKEYVIFITVICLTVITTCTLLNILVYNTTRWSVPVDGVFLTLWVFFMTAIFCEKITVYGMLLFDAVAIGNYMFMISNITRSDEWFYAIGLPILITIFVLLELIVLLNKKVSSSLLAGTLYFFIMTAIVCLVVEATLDLYFHQAVSLSWSAVVLTVCLTIGVVLSLVMMMERVRKQIRRRLHF